MLAVRYLPDRFLLDKAVDAIDEAGALAKRAGKDAVELADLAGPGVGPTPAAGRWGGCSHLHLAGLLVRGVPGGEDGEVRRGRVVADPHRRRGRLGVHALPQAPRHLRRLRLPQVAPEHPPVRPPPRPRHPPAAFPFPAQPRLRSRFPRPRRVVGRRGGGGGRPLAAELGHQRGVPARRAWGVGARASAGAAPRSGPRRFGGPERGGNGEATVVAGRNGGEGVPAEAEDERPGRQQRQRPGRQPPQQRPRPPGPPRPPGQRQHRRRAAGPAGPRGPPGGSRSRRPLCPGGARATSPPRRRRSVAGGRARESREERRREGGATLNLCRPGELLRCAANPAGEGPEESAVCV